MKLPSVTTVLSPFSDFSKIRPEVLKRAADRGSRVHAACAIYAKGLWANCALCPGDGPFFDSFMKWSDMVASRICLGRGRIYRFTPWIHGAPGRNRENVWRQSFDSHRLQNADVSNKNMAAPNSRICPSGKKGGYDIQRGLAVRLRKKGTGPNIDTGRYRRRTLGGISERAWSLQVL